MFDLAGWLQLAKTCGPTAAIIIYFIWRDARREDRMAIKNDSLESQIRESLLPLVEKCAKVIAANTSAIQRFLSATKPPRRKPKTRGRKLAKRA